MREAALALMSIPCGCSTAAPVRTGPTDAATTEGLSTANRSSCGDGSVAADAHVPPSCDSMTQTCVQTQIDTCPAGDCGHCAFTTGASCGADTPCTTPALCIPSVGCGDADGWPSYCVVP